VACCTPDEPHGNSVASVAEVADQFEGVGIPGLAQLLQLAHDRIPTCVRSRLRPTFRGPPDDAQVVHLTKGIHIPGIPRLEPGFYDLHILLRHRLPLQADRYEGRFLVHEVASLSEQPVPEVTEDAAKRPIDCSAGCPAPSDHPCEH
jgi:hypothetical protein